MSQLALCNQVHSASFIVCGDALGRYYFNILNEVALQGHCKVYFEQTVLPVVIVIPKPEYWMLGGPSGGQESTRMRSHLATPY